MAARQTAPPHGPDREERLLEGSLKSDLSDRAGEADIRNLTQPTPGHATEMPTPPPSPMGGLVDFDDVPRDSLGHSARTSDGLASPPPSPSSSGPPSSAPAGGIGSILRRLRKRVQTSQPGRQEEVCLDSLCEQAERLLLGRDGNPRDDVRAVQLLRRAAAQNHTHAQVGIYGRLSHRASDGSIAQALLGFAHEFGLGLDTQDFKEAETLYIAAANGGSGLAQARLAFLRKYGRPGVRIDRVEAEQWVKKVQEKGPTAIEWLRQAADKDNHPAGWFQTRLGGEADGGADVSPASPSENCATTRSFPPRLPFYFLSQLRFGRMLP